MIITPATQEQIKAAAVTAIRSGDPGKFLTEYVMYFKNQNEIRDILVEIEKLQPIKKTTPTESYFKISDAWFMTEYERGAYAMMWHILCRAANHWHGDPKIDKLCQEENALIIDWMEDALLRVAPNLYARYDAQMYAK